MVNVVVRSATKTALTLLKMSVVELLLIVVNFVDIIFSLWDPFGYNSMFPKVLPRDIMRSAERSLRNEVRVAYAEYTSTRYARNY